MLEGNLHHGQVASESQKTKQTLIVRNDISISRFYLCFLLPFSLFFLLLPC